MTCQSIRRRQRYGLAIVTVSIAAVSVFCARAEAQLRVAPDALDRPLALPTAENWLVLARAHTPGVFDESAATVSAWGSDGTMAAVQLVTRKSTDVGLLARGLLLHTDLALIDRAATQTAPSHGPPGGLTLQDARAVNVPRRPFHWGVARRIATALAKLPGGSPVARAWYRAAGALYQSWADLGPLRAHLTAGAELFPDDPVLLLYTGALRQGYADARVQSYVALLRRRAENAGMPNAAVLPAPIAVEKAHVELSLAEDALRRAIALDPSLVEARIRLAHVVGARGKPAEAVALARAALANPLPAFLDYYGAMVLGRNEVRLGHAAEARAAFERAASRYPDDQAAQVALSHVGLLEGRYADGLETVVRALGPDAPADGDEPWSWYFRRHEPDAKRRLEDLRRSVK
jgi:tetratricopeptide (TPR) repeat protein